MSKSAPSAQQLSLLDLVSTSQSLPRNSEGVVSMKPRLLRCLENLVQAMEAESTLPNIVYYDDLGVVCGKPRCEVLCRGYTYREMANEQKLAQMLLSVCIGLTMFDFAKSLYKLKSLPDTQLMREAIDIIEEYKSNGGIIDEQERTGSD